MSSFTNTSNFDNLMLQTLLGRLQIGPPNAPHNPLFSRSLEDLFLGAADGFSDNSDDENPDDSRTQLAREESKLEKEIVRMILSGKAASLKPNSGQAVTVGEHHICVGFQEDKGYRVWEWHGHIMLFDEENGYTPEYIYGNHFERLQVKWGESGGVKKGNEEEEEEDGEDKEEEKLGNLGLRELIDGGDSGGARILHRNVNTGSSNPRSS